MADTSGAVSRSSAMFGQPLIDSLCRRFELDDDIKLSSMAKFDTILGHKSFVTTTRQSKVILSAVSVYLSVTEDHTPLTIGQICLAIGFTLNDFARVYNQVIKDFPNLKSESLSVEELAEYVLKSLNVDDEERQPLVRRTIELIRIVRQCWLIEGRSPSHIIYASAYLAWKSLKPSDRTKVKLTGFCGTVGLPSSYRITTAKRVNEFLQALKKLGQKIPGKEKLRFSQNNIAIYIEDIINYANSLLYDLSNEASHRFRAIAADSDSNFGNTYIRKLRSSAKRRKKNTSAVDCGQTDDEISDSEINCYIRTEAEVKKIKKLKAFVEMEDTDDEAAEEDMDQVVKHIEIADLKGIL